jgi:uncharacterized protein YegJ (DUF2314 family)
MTKRPLPFSVILGTEPEVVANRFTGESVTLPPDAVAVYDCIIGAEMVGNYAIVRKGLDWFRRYFPEEYMVLLD